MPNRTADERDDPKTSAICAAVLGGVLSVFALGLYGPKPAASVALGAAIAVANLLVMRAIVRALLPPPEGDDAAPKPPEDVDHRGAGKRGGAAWGVFAVLKILVLFGGLWLLLTKRLVDPIPLVVGYGVLPLGIAAASLWANLRPSRRN